MKKYPIKKFSILVCLAGIGIILSAFFWGVYESGALTDNMDSAKGIVVGFAEKKSFTSNFYRKRWSISYSPVVRFNTKSGRTVNFTSGVSSRLSIYAKGDPVQVMYDPSHPENARIDDFFSLYLGPAIAGGAGLLLTLLGSAVIILPGYKNRKFQSLRQTGQALETSFQEVRINRNIKLGGNSPHKIITKWINPDTKEEHIFASNNLWFDPGNQVNQDKITVYIEQGNPKKYFMDLSFLDEKKSM